MSIGSTYAPFSDEHVANPYPFFAEARAQEPVFFSEQLGYWVVSRYDDAAAVLKDYRRFTASNLSARQQSEQVRAILGDSVMVPSLQEVDPPDHTQLRGAIMKGFSARRVSSLEPVIRAFADRLIDRFGASGDGDFMKMFSEPFPMMVIGHLMGVPEQDWHHLQRWSDDIMAMMLGSMSEDEELPYAKSALDFKNHVYDIVERRRSEPGDDLTTALIESSLDDDQIAGLLQLLLLAGFETTVKLLGLALRELLTDRAHWQAIVDDPSGIPAVVEEALRFDGPVVSLIRQAQEDVEVGGRQILKGQMVQVLLGSANHDEAVFEDPESFCPARKGASAHLTLGAGAHYCLGAALARMEAKVALEQLTRRLPSLRLVPDQEIEYLPNLNMRGPLGLRVAWGSPG
ncbi:cytochrome P450 [Lentzea tibetensis]|uniref:Cytochrome P450 n=1 Tax=Lentzea tibetensis TaxID=2591470 RepID=A0A563F0G0_9PSEU|nr:cytochrome P450 [Lentzea tibetensis]TWP53268.1 cytochrome P450 [Lentzea tibetensis]